MHQLRGNPSKISKERLAAGNFTPPPGRPTCPPHLQGEAREEFERLATLLGNVVTEADRGCLAAIATCWQRHVIAERAIAEKGLFSALGSLNPAVRVSREAVATLAKLSREYGLTPASRTNVTPTAAPQTPGNPFDQFKGTDKC